MKKDWKGNAHSNYVTIGASNHSKGERQPRDYYATDPRAAELLLQHETFDGPIWECACGEKNLSKVFEAHGHEVRSSDIEDRCGNEVLDFLGIENWEPWDGNIITNPPYAMATEFVYRALQLVGGGKKVCMFLRTLFLEGRERKSLFLQFPPKVVYVFSGRIACLMNNEGDFDRAGAAQSYSWFVWEKGYQGDTIVKWIN